MDDKNGSFITIPIWLLKNRFKSLDYLGGTGLKAVGYGGSGWVVVGFGWNFTLIIAWYKNISVPSRHPRNFKK